MNGMETKSAGPFDVGQVVVDQHRLRRLKVSGAADQLVDRGVGLAAADKARDHEVAETAKKGMLAPTSPACPGVEEGGRIGQQIERRAGRMQALDQADHLWKGMVEHLVEAVVEGPDQFCV